MVEYKISKHSKNHINRGAAIVVPTKNNVQAGIHALLVAEESEK